MALDHEAHVVVHVVELLAPVYRLVAVVDGAGTVAKVPVFAPIRYCGEAGGDAVAEGEGRRGERVDREVLRVAGVVAAVEGDDGVGKGDEEGEGDERRDDEGLRFVWVSLRSVSRCEASTSRGATWLSCE